MRFYELSKSVASYMSQVLVVYDVKTVDACEEAGMTRNGRPPSMADVAELVEVSHQTVSRVVNGSKGRLGVERERAGCD